MSDQQRAVVAGLATLGLGALAVGKHRGKKKREQYEERATEVPIRG